MEEFVPFIYYSQNINFANSIASINSSLYIKRNFYPNITSLGITSTFIPDIIEAMPNNSTFIANVNGTGIYDNTKNQLPQSAGILTIEKTTSYARVIFNRCNSGASYGHLYLASVDMQNKAVKGWFDFSGTLLS